MVFSETSPTFFSAFVNYSACTDSESGLFVIKLDFLTGSFLAHELGADYPSPLSLFLVEKACTDESSMIVPPILPSNLVNARSMFHILDFEAWL